MRQLQFRSTLPLACPSVKLGGSAWELGWIGARVQAATCDLETSFAAQGKIKACAAVNSSRRYARKPHPPVTHLFVVCAVYSRCRRRRSFIRRPKAVLLKSKAQYERSPRPGEFRSSKMRQSIAILSFLAGAACADDVLSFVFPGGSYRSPTVPA
jgi:hypothetical protein